MALQDGLKMSIQVPLTVSRLANSVWPQLKELARIGNVNCKSDMQVRTIFKTTVQERELQPYCISKFMTLLTPN